MAGSALGDGRMQQDEHENYLQLSEPEIKEAEEKSSTTVRVVHEAVRREGEDELKRTTRALAWSGLAAGLSMGFSLMIEGVLAARLPKTEWSELVSKFGYSAGFLFVILGRQQLFTENTLTPILPLLHKPDAATARNVARLWAAVLLTNLCGALIIACVLANTAVFQADVRASFAELGGKSLNVGFGLAMLRGVFAGWLMALLVWVLPFAEHARFFVIIAVTWMIGICGLTHVVAGAVEAFYMAFQGGVSWPHAVFGYILPAFLGNVLGGVSLVAALNHAQVVT